MKQPLPFLIFNGNCKEALLFYEKCLKGEIIFVKNFGESPLELPDEQKKMIYDSEFRTENIVNYLIFILFHQFICK